MEAQSPGDFMLMRRRKKKSTRKSQRPAQAEPSLCVSSSSMTSFIQSALSSTEKPTSLEQVQLSAGQPGSGRKTEGSDSGRKSRAGSGTKRSAHNISPKKSISRARKKLKLDMPSRNWDMLMASKWPDHKEISSSDDNSDIDSYSDIEVHAAPSLPPRGEETDSEDIQDQTGVSSPPPSLSHWKGPVSAGKSVSSNKGKKQQQHGRGPRRLHTSTPLQHHQEFKTTSENIEDIESRSSDSEDSVHHAHSLHDFISSTSKPLKLASSSKLPWSTLNVNSDQEYLDITSPPSSPLDEPSNMTTTDPNVTTTELYRTKTSDWVRQLHMESMESNLSHHDVPCNLNETMRTPLDSAKKTRGKKLVAGGLAEQLQKVIKRESSETTFWEHKAKKMEEKDIDLSSCLTVHVVSLVNCYSLFIATCRVLQGNAQPQAQYGYSAMMEHSQNSDISQPLVEQSLIPPVSSSSLQFPQSHRSGPLSMNECGRYIDHLEQEEEEVRSKPDEGSRERNGGEDVIVFFSQRCAKYLSLSVGSHVRIHPPWQCLHLPALSKDVILCSHFCRMVGHTHVPTATTPTSTIPCKQRGVTGVCSLLSPEKTPPPVHSMLTKSPVKGLLPTRLFADDATAPGERSHELMMEARTVNEPVDIKPSVRMSFSLPLQALEYAQDGVLPAVCVRILRVYRRKMMHSGQQEERWSLLVCDAAETFAELLVPDCNTSPQWCDLIKSGQCKAVHLTSLRLLKKTYAARNPELFSLIISLKRQLSSTTKSTDDAVDNEAVHPVTPVSCYVLVTQSDTEVVETDDDSRLPVLVEPPYLLLPEVGNGGTNKHPSRLSLLAKVVHTHLEVLPIHDDDSDHPADTLPVPTTGYQSGYYLFVVSPTSSSTSQLLRIYLKTGFSVSGLEKLLVKPGSEVLLRDIQREILKDGDIHYSMDACSLIYPLSCQGPDHLVYPIMNHPSSDDIEDTSSLLSHLSPPSLPVLDPTTAKPATLVSLTGSVVGVDDENAYSWPTCEVCGCEKLGSEELTTSELYCDNCQRVVTCPVYQMQLSVFIDTNQLTVLVQLLQSTIHRLLPVSTANINNGFDVHSILHKGITLKSCYVLGIKETESGDKVLALEEVNTCFPT